MLFCGNISAYALTVFACTPAATHMLWVFNLVEFYVYKCILSARALCARGGHRIVCRDVKIFINKSSLIQYSSNNFGGNWQHFWGPHR